MLFRAEHSFQGDHLSGQLSFPAGATIFVQSDPNHHRDGWTYGRFDNMCGWFPSSFVTPLAVNEPDQKCLSVTLQSSKKTNLHDENFGFEGPPMGSAPGQTISYTNKAGFGGAIMPAPWTEPTVVPPFEETEFSYQEPSPSSNQSSQGTKAHLLFAKVKAVGHRLVDVSHQKKASDSKDQSKEESAPTPVHDMDREKQFRQPPAEHVYDNAVAISFPAEENKRHRLFGSKTITTQRTETKTIDEETLVTVTQTKTKKGLFRTRIYETKTISRRPKSMAE